MESTHFLHRPVTFHTPDRVVDPPSWLGHTPFAFWIVDAMRPATFVELGCHSGNSYSAFAQAVQTLNLPTACYAVDTWLGDPHAGAFVEGVFAEWREYHDRRFSSFSRLVRSTFDEALEHFLDGAIDLLHIDGYHTFDAVSHDFDAWRPKMSARGVVLFHDINVREKDFGAWRVWERVSREYPSFAFRHGHGLGVIGVGQDLAEPLEWLFTTDADEANTVRLFFARLGASVTAHHAAAQAQKATAEMRQELDFLRSEHAQVLDARAAMEDACRISAAETDRLAADNIALTGELEQTQQALTARIGEVQALASRLETRETARTHPTIVVVSHVGGWQPRSGNEYRMHRMLQWYRCQGYRVIPVIAPLPGEELSREAVAATAAAFGNVIQVHRDGRVEHDLRDVPEEFPPMPSRQPPTAAIEETGDGAAGSQELRQMDAMFCHGPVMATVLHLQESLGPHVLQVEYIWMTGLLPLVRADVLKVIDTIDVFSSIDRKVGMFGVRDVAVSPREEADRLRRGDLIVAIQDEERQELQRLAPNIPVVTAGVDFDVIASTTTAIDGPILFVASGNPRNRKGLTDFVRLAWPRIRRRVPGAELMVVGGVAAALDGRHVPGLSVVGTVRDVAPLYRQAAVVINPVVAGTGVKVKTIEALCHLRPIVTWPAGVDGLEPRLAARCVVVRDWYAFAKAVVDVLTTGDVTRWTDDDRAVIAELLSPEATYAELHHAYRTFFEQHHCSAPTPASSRSEAGRLTPAATHAD